MKNTLLVDAGNSAIKWAVKSSALSLSVMAQKRYSANVTESFFAECWGELDNPEKILVTSVANELVWQALKNSCLALWQINPERVVSTAKGFSLVNAYEQPEQLGSDRWCAMIGAYHEANSAVIVIDCGSAVTVDVIEPSGQHIGGYILPGLQMMKHSLSINTAQVDVATETKIHTLAPGRTTADCANAGLYLAIVSSIEAIVEQQSGQLTDFRCYLTGGDAASIAEYLSINYVMMPDLVLRGLAFISENNQD